MPHYKEINKVYDGGLITINSLTFLLSTRACNDVSIFQSSNQQLFLVSKHHGGRLLETPATRLASGQIVLKNSRNGKY